MTMPLLILRYNNVDIIIFDTHSNVNFIAPSCHSIRRRMNRFVINLMRDISPSLCNHAAADAKRRRRGTRRIEDTYDARNTDRYVYDGNINVDFARFVRINLPSHIIFVLSSCLAHHSCVRSLHLVPSFIHSFADSFHTVVVCTTCCSLSTSRHDDNN